MNVIAFKPVATAVLLGVVILCPNASTRGGEPLKYVIGNNNTEGKTANDLHIKFTGKVESAYLFLGDNIQGYKGQTKSDGDGTEFYWETHMMPELPAGQKATIRYWAEANGVTINEALSYLTYEGNPISGFTIIAEPPKIELEKDPHSGKQNGFIQLHNPEQFAVAYTGFMVFKDNNLGNYFNDDWDIPTGILVKGLPRRFVLGPGQSAEFAIGEVQPWTYVLALVQAATVNDPADRYGLGAALAVYP